MFNWKIGVGALKHPGFNGGSPPPPSAPTQTTVMNTNIPDYAQPYVENMLNAAQAQIYNPSGTGFNQYVPYSADPTNYIAGFSPLQQQAQSAAANLQVPGQYGMATRQTLGATGAMGRLAPQMGMAGANYAAQATSPYATAAYMNPYIGASLAPQLQLANQQYGIAGQKEGSAAAQAGAFGGSRNALMNALNTQNQMLAQNQLISQGYNTAFQNAQQAQQFGANLGLQGQQAQLAALQGQLSGANQLGGLGGAQLAAQQGILGTQAQQGALEQQNQQNIINQAVQNYATAQQYPFMQLGVLNSMLRGLPMQQSTTAMYQAPPNMASQLGSLGVAGIGAAQVLGAGKKSGGVIKAAGGIPMKMYSKDQLQQVQQSPIASPMAKLYGAGLMQENTRMQDNPMAKQVMAQPLPTPPVQNPIDPRVGVASIATPPDMTQMAGGGIIAFVGGGDTAKDGDVLTPPEGYDMGAENKPEAKPTMEKAPAPKAKSPARASDLASDDYLRNINHQVLTKGLQDYLSGKNTASEAIKEAQIQEAKSIQADKDRQLGLAMLEGGFKGLQNTSPYFGVGLGTLGSGVVGSYAKQQQTISEAEKEMRKEKLEAQKADEARQSDIFGKAMGVEGTLASKDIGLAQIRSNQANMDAMRREALGQKITQNIQTQVSNLYGKLSKERPDLLATQEGQDQLQAEALRRVLAITPQSQLQLAGYDMSALTPQAPTTGQFTYDPTTKKLVPAK
jgi:hypothetical protein